MRYQPCYIATCFQALVPKGTKVTLDDVLNDRVKRGPYYYQAKSNKVVGDCGHKHRTEKAAEPCLAKLKKKWSEWRSETCRAAAAKRKAQA